VEKEGNEREKPEEIGESKLGEPAISVKGLVSNASQKRRGKDLCENQ